MGSGHQVRQKRSRGPRKSSWTFLQALHSVRSSVLKWTKEHNRTHAHTHADTPTHAGDRQAPHVAREEQWHRQQRQPRSAHTHTQSPSPGAALIQSEISAHLAFPAWWSPCDRSPTSPARSRTRRWRMGCRWGICCASAPGTWAGRWGHPGCWNDVEPVVELSGTCAPPWYNTASRKEFFRSDLHTAAAARLKERNRYHKDVSRKTRLLLIHRYKVLLLTHWKKLLTFSL